MVHLSVLHQKVIAVNEIVLYGGGEGEGERRGRRGERRGRREGREEGERRGRGEMREKGRGKEWWRRGGWLTRESTASGRLALTALKTLTTSTWSSVISWSVNTQSDKQATATKTITAWEVHVNTHTDTNTHTHTHTHTHSTHNRERTEREALQEVYMASETTN